MLTYNGKLIETFYSASNGGQTELPGNQWGGGEAKERWRTRICRKRTIRTIWKILPAAKRRCWSCNRFRGSSEDVSGGLPYTYAKEQYQALQKAAYDALVARGEPVPSANHSPAAVHQPGGQLGRVQHRRQPPVQQRGGHAQRAVHQQQWCDGDTACRSGDDFDQQVRFQLLQLRPCDAQRGEGLQRLEHRRAASTGHGVGMSQRGAQWLAQQYKRTYQQILAFYFDSDADFDFDITRLSSYDTSIPSMRRRTASIAAAGPTSRRRNSPSARWSSRDARQCAYCRNDVLHEPGQGEHRDTLPYYGMTNGWFKVQYNGQIAYIYGQYGTVQTTPTPTPTPTPVAPSEACLAFVRSLYTNVMGREADSTGLNFWANGLSTTAASGSQVVLEFVESDEFEAKSVSMRTF